MIRFDETYSKYFRPADKEYPWGAAIDATGTENINGTPYKARWRNDVVGMMQALFYRAFSGTGRTPTNAPDSVLYSDIADAIEQLIKVALANQWAQTEKALESQWQQTENAIAGQWQKTENVVNAQWQKTENALAGQWQQTENAIADQWQKTEEALAAQWQQTEEALNQWYQVTVQGAETVVRWSVFGKTYDATKKYLIVAVPAGNYEELLPIATVADFDGIHIFVRRLVDNMIVSGTRTAKWGSFIFGQRKFGESERMSINIAIKEISGSTNVIKWGTFVFGKRKFGEVIEEIDIETYTLKWGEFVFGQRKFGEAIKNVIGKTRVIKWGSFVFGQRKFGELEAIN